MKNTGLTVLEVITLIFVILKWQNLVTFNWFWVLFPYIVFIGLKLIIIIRKLWRK